MGMRVSAGSGRQECWAAGPAGVCLETPVTKLFREKQTMKKMSSQEFTAGMDRFLKVLESQPQLLVTRHPSAGEGAKIAEMASGFIQRLHELRLQAIQGGEE